GEVERDPELHRGYRQTAFDVVAAGVEGLDLELPGLQVGFADELIPAGPDPLRMADRLIVGRVLALGVEVPPPQLTSAQPQFRCDLAEDILHHEHPLRSAEAAEGRL